MTESLLDPNTTPPTIDPNTNYLVELVGDGKKFKDPESLARGKYEADIHIENMNKKFDELREMYLKEKSENTTRATLEELKTLITQPKQPSSNEQTPVNEENSKPPLDLTQIDSLLSTKLKEHTLEQKRTENYNLVKKTLTERFGNNYSTVLSQAMDDLNLSEQYITDLARTSPKAFFNTLGLNEQEKETFQSPPRSDQRSTSFKPATQKRTWSYYQNLKKTNPRLYFDPKINTQMTKDAIELGEAFNDGDFYA